MEQRSAEVYVISAIIQTGGWSRVDELGLTQEHFQDYEDVWSWVERFAIEHGATPGKVAFKHQWPDFPLLKTTDLDWAASELKSQYLSRNLISAVKDAASTLRGNDPVMALRDLHSAVMRLDRDYDVSRMGTDIIANTQPVLDEVVERVDRVASTGSAGIPTGFLTLDERSGGLKPGELWVVAARLGNGKTWTACRMASWAAYKGYRVQYDALEQSANQVAMRIYRFFAAYLALSGFTVDQLNTGKGLDLLKFKHFLERVPEAIPGSLNVSDTGRGRVTTGTIAAQIEANRPDVVFIDYLTLLGTNGERNWQSIGELTSELKTIAQRYDIPIVAAAQVNRAGGSGKLPPGADSLAESDAIGQDADGIVTLKKVSRSVMHLFLAKYRHGQDGYRWWCAFQPDKGRYDECSYDDAMDLRDQDADEEDEQ